MQKLGIIVNHQTPRASEALDRVVAYSRELGLQLYGVEETRALTQSPHIASVENVAEFEGLVELVIVLGGDGTLLHGARMLSGTGLPLMGFNIGSLGYLTCVDEEHFRDALEDLKNNSFKISERMTLEASLMKADGTTVEIDQLAINDVVVTRGVSARLIHLSLSINDKPLTTYVCDGVIVATPTGSTAYSLSAGGPIVLPDTDALTISVICPHTLGARPIVVPSESRLELHCLKSSGAMLLSLDGNENIYLNNGDKVTVRRSEKKARVAFVSSFNPFEVLNRKLGWGGSLEGRVRKAQ